METNESSSHCNCLLETACKGYIIRDVQYYNSTINDNCSCIVQANAMMRDVLLEIRADEGHHREVNHTLGSMTLYNPYGLG